MSIFLGDSEVSKIFVGDSPVSGVFVGDTKIRPSFRTFTISRTEQTDMSSGWTYSDDATGLTAGSTDFDDFFGYSAVLLNTSGTETSEVTQSLGVMDVTELGNISSGDNVMIKFPRRGIKMTKAGSVVTLSITDNPHAEADGFQYYAHSRGTFSSPVDKDYFYLGAYKGGLNGGVLKSRSDLYGTLVNGTQAQCIAYARANDNNNGSAGYDIEGFYQRMYVNALYMMKYGNPNSQSVIGNGYTGATSRFGYTGSTDSHTEATWGTTLNSLSGVKLFGLEHRWGDIMEWIGGVCLDDYGLMYTALSGFTGAKTTTGNYESTGTTVSGNNIITSIGGTNKTMFVQTGATTSTNTEYYCDRAVTVFNLMLCGGRYDYGGLAGAFCSYISAYDETQNSYTGARLMYL